MIGRAGSADDRGEAAADQAMCAVPRKQKFPERQRFREACARQDFKSFRSTDA
jgi:hypothetical protein